MSLLPKGHSAHHPSGYKMIRSAEIKNFRCFESVRLQDCRTINIVVGRNASGKTALLEAIFLALGASPEVVLRFRAWRGFEGNLGGTTRDIDRTIWRDLFNNFDLNKVINIDLKGSDNHSRSLRARYKVKEDFITTPVGPKASPTFPSQIEFNYKRHKTPEHKVTAEYRDQTFHFRGVDQVVAESAFFASGYPFPNSENIERFSRISKSRQVDRLIEAISAEFGFIRGIEVLYHAGQPALHVDTPWFDEKVPLSAISSGVAKLVALMIAVIATPHSVLIVDEIENGFYYDRFPSIWRTLHRLCKESDVQLFASTHSWECLEGLKVACQDHQDDVSFIRSTAGKAGGSLEQFHGSTIIPAMEDGEIR